MDGTPEIGWVLAPWSHGKGFATEAGGAAVAWGDQELGAVRTVCIIEPEHAASIRVAEKCDYRKFATATCKGEATVVFQRPGSSFS